MFNTTALIITAFLNITPDAISPGSWKPGDSADYSLRGGLISGTVHMQVRSRVARGIWVDQSIDLGGAGIQKVETLYDANTAAVLELIVNGKREQTPEPVAVSTKNDRITVPRGSYDCEYTKYRDRKTGKNTEIWANASIPINGLAKTIVPSMAGPMTLELTDFEKK